ncbi:olfactory receptor 6C4-like [Emydura macquarii macquarii]|uniref:olfactory receptor 6C4-like n=1 Tax=Emydura macquarii macquarii TaxID=1129001 RepID=UPI00352A676D
MELGNQSSVSEFVLLGFPHLHHLGLLLFLVHLLIYLLTLAGNVVIIAITWADHHLHTPMYFFLRSFSFLEICFTSVIIPKMLANFLSEDKTISFAGCILQDFFYLSLGVSEFLLLAAMSVDRYVAICYPLHYMAIMSGRICILMVLSSWFGGFFFITGLIVMISRLSFCSPNILNHFFCDLGPLVSLSCSSTRLVESMDFLVAAVVLLGSLAVTMVSYSYIVATVIHIPSDKERRKAFSTCSSHIIVLSIFYGSCIFMYVRPKQHDGLDITKGVAILNTVITPMLNPFIYSLRNKLVIQVLKDALCWKK